MVDESDFCKRHLDFFTCHAEPVSWIASDPSKWLQGVGVTLSDASLTDQKFDRARLKEMAGANEISGRDVVWSILCWGKMRRDHARAFCKCEGKVAELVDKIRGGSLSRADSYNEFAKLRQNNYLDGVGPAYFTKLIFFSSPTHDGYIMDQWTARSVNLLLNEPIIKMDGNYVSSRNDCGCFKKFCEAIEKLTAIKTRSSEGWTNKQTEMALFSRGGRNPDPWRQYVRNNG